MRSPFPGVDPYLERPVLWPDVHNSLLAAIRDAVAPDVAPRYYVALERHVYALKPDDLAFIGRPDVAVVQRLEAATPSRWSRPGRGDDVFEDPQVRHTGMVREVDQPGLGTVRMLGPPATSTAWSVWARSRISDMGTRNAPARSHSSPRAGRAHPLKRR